MEIRHYRIERFMESESVEDITEEVMSLLKESGIKEGIMILFAQGSTAGLSMMEYEPGLKKDIFAALERISPKDAYYKHHETWHDDNGRSHVRATLMGFSLALPIINGDIPLGTWQQIVLFNFDTRRRKRIVYCTVMGSK